MTGSAWVATVFGAVMIVAAAAAAVRLIAARTTHRSTDYEVDIHNVLMGVSMAGMLLPTLQISAPGVPAYAWLVVWILVTVWFAISVVRSQHPRTRRFSGHHLAHLIMSVAMVYMFAVAVVPAVGGHDITGSPMPGMTGVTSGAHRVPLATLDYLFALFMVGYTVLVVDRLSDGAEARVGTLTGGAPAAASARLVAPTTAGITNIAMGLTMAYMLVMMLG